MVNIEISQDTYDMILEIKEKNETIDDTISKLLDEYYEDLNEDKNKRDDYDDEEDILY